MSVNAPVDMERRDRTLEDVEIRRDTASTPIGFVGHASVFESRAAIGDPSTWGFFETVMPGAFTKTIREADIPLLRDHDSSLLLARTSNGTLRLGQDDVGLAVDADMAPTSYGRDTALLLERRDLKSMSIGFRPVKGKEEWRTIWVDGPEGGYEAELRVLHEVRLFDVSVVTVPAFEATDAALRALRHRCDPDPLHRRRHLFPATDGEPRESTRPSEPVITTPHLSVPKRWEALARRHGLPVQLPTTVRGNHADSPGST